MKILNFYAPDNMFLSSLDADQDDISLKTPFDPFDCITL